MPTLQDPTEAAAAAPPARPPGGAGLPARLRLPSARTLGADLVLVAAALAPATLVGLALHALVPADSLVMVYMVAVAFAAGRRGRVAAVAAVLGSIVLFSICFVEPRGAFLPLEPRYWLVFAVMLVVGLVIGHLAVRARQQATTAESRARRAQALSRLAQALALARSEAAVRAALQTSLADALGMQAVVLADPQHSQAGAYPIPLCSEGHVLGVAWLQGWPAPHHSPEDHDLARALCDQAALALDRARFEQRSVASALEAERERVRTTLLAGISHDFRTPLTTIMGSATALLDQAAGLSEADRAALLRELLSQAERLHRLSSNLLELTRLESGAVRPVPEWCPADELLAEAVDALGARAAGRRIELHAPDELAVWCDPGLLGQALVNLLDNALRHSGPQGRVRATVDARDAHWTLQVHDDGPGVPPGQEQAVFERFHRGAPRGDDRGKGLGLAICAAVAQLHGGQIGVHNDHGACFVMRLPQPPAPDPATWKEAA